MTAAVSQAVSIPVIASGGAGTLDDFVDVFTDRPRRRRAGRVDLSLRGNERARAQAAPPATGYSGAPMSSKQDKSRTKSQLQSSS